MFTPTILDTHAAAIRQATHALDTCSALADDSERRSDCDRLKSLRSTYLAAQAKVLDLAKASSTDPGKSLEAKEPAAALRRATGADRPVSVPR